jgi:hypothetical protein
MRVRRIINIDKELDGCGYECPYYEVYGNEMTCDHPTLKNSRNPFAGLIITQDNSGDGQFPEECPLREEQD